MKISAKGDYACKAVLELTLKHQEGKPVQIGEIAKNQSIPLKYLEQILVVLKKGGIAKSKRGAEGGYSLAKNPKDITVADVIALTDGPFVTTPCSDDNCETQDVCCFLPIWSELEKQIYKVLSGTNFEELSEKVNQGQQLMYHI
ncbi:Rrf2 family transcriptional regulator [Proteinivorax hydrogeniformans]|uniref:Rrf2 family transcriptional regulator n=1 Tax=Proteinivorax hydrogeniformans TaxID=1826727 RepID=A0AAU8HR02_9FIRM